MDILAQVNFSYQPRGVPVDGAVMFSVGELENIRGSFYFTMQNGSIIEENAPVLIYMMEFLNFLKRTIARSSDYNVLELYFEPRLFSQYRQETVILTWFDPRVANPDRNNHLEVCSVRDIKILLSDAERILDHLLEPFSQDLRRFVSDCQNYDDGVDASLLNP